MPCKNEARQRRITIAFRVTPEENERINHLVAMSGMLKQDYIVSKLEDVEIHIEPNVRIYKGMRTAAKAIYLELRRIQSIDELNEETRSVMRCLAGMLKDLGCYNSNEVAPSVNEARDIMNLSRE